MITDRNTFLWPISHKWKCFMQGTAILSWPLPLICPCSLLDFQGRGLACPTRHQQLTVHGRHLICRHEAIPVLTASSVYLCGHSPKVMTVVISFLCKKEKKNNLILILRTNKQGICTQCRCHQRPTRPSPATGNLLWPGSVSQFLLCLTVCWQFPAPCAALHKHTRMLQMLPRSPQKSCV